MKKVIIGFLMVFCFSLLLVDGALSFYYPPANIPPGPPPNYTVVDTSYFLGTPSIPPPKEHFGGIYVWYDQGMWQIANHIYCLGLSHEQFHCAVLAVMDYPPTPGINIFAEHFEFWPDSTKPACLKQNDRWGWKPWGEKLYEIWWDVTTRQGKEGGMDQNDFLKITIVGHAVDFNLWTSGMGDAFSPDEVFLGAEMMPLSSTPDYYDFFSGISDPYQSQAGSDPSNTPNITIFTEYSDTLRTFNALGLIDSTDSYTCELALEYGLRYAGTFAYEGNGIQFSTNAIYIPNDPPELQVPDDTSYVVCTGNLLTFEVCAIDPDLDDTLILEKIDGPGVFPADTGTSPLCNVLTWNSDSDTSVEFVFRVIDRYKAVDEDTVMVTVDLNDPPELTVPADFDTFLCDTTTVCFDIEVVDSNDNAKVEVEQPGYYADNKVCFPAYEEKDYCLEIIASDSCEESDSEEVCITVSLSDPPAVDAPDTVYLSQGDTSEYTFTANDPDGETLNDDAGISVAPDCGEYSVIRLSGSGTSNGEWKVTFKDTGCALGYYMVVVEVEDSCGRTGVDTTILEIQSRPNNAPIVNVPELDSSFVDSTVKYIAQAADPDSDALLDDARIKVIPDCGSTGETRFGEIGRPSGTWEIVFQTSGCSSGGYQVIVEIEDTLGATGAGTTYVVLMPHTGIDEAIPEKVTSFFLKQNYPNPFNLNTEINFQLPKECKVELKIYNLKGQKVKTLVEEEMARGIYTLHWDGRDNAGHPVASGIYFFKLKTSDFECVRKMVLLK